MPVSRRPLFVAAILVGSFLLFLVQPLMARLALPRLGGTPNVWNSAMLVYQALLLGGYAYAHAIGRLPLRRQMALHLGLLAAAALTLPLTLAEIGTFGAGLEVFWVPALLLASVGPVFFLISAQAPLIQRWYAADPQAGDPYPLYAASNLGSFAGLVSYPLLIEPFLPLGAQSLIWSLGYGAMVVLLALVASARWNVGARWSARQEAGAGHGTVPAQGADGAMAAGAPITWRRIGLWLALAAVPSGLMLSTTTHLTTDIFAMPLLWVIPLGVYLLSFSLAFAENRAPARIVSRAAPYVLLFAGAMAMVSQSIGGIGLLLGAVTLLFVVAVALHARMYETRPEPERLTLFYLVMSAGGALGGLFTALIAPLLFDWVWEHPLLVFAAAALVPVGGLMAWQQRLVSDPARRLLWVLGGVGLALLLAWHLFLATANETKLLALALFLALAAMAVALKFNRLAFLTVFALIMIGIGGPGQGRAYAQGERLRSYFGVYTLTEFKRLGLRQLTHGTTLHGRQALDPALRREPTTYYGRSAGVGLVLANAAHLFGPGADVGIVGLGTGTLACYRQGDQSYRFYEIDPAVLAFSRAGRFSYLADCAPESETVIGDARIKLEAEPAGQYDVLVVDAFSSDAIPLHLLTREALAAYRRAIRPQGLVVVHISNRFIELEPVLAALARDAGMAAAVRFDRPAANTLLTPSKWVVLAPSPQTLAALSQASGAARWQPLALPSATVWSDQYASTLAHFRWNTLIGS